MSPCSSLSPGSGSPVMTQPVSSLGVAGGCVPSSHCFHSHSLFPGGVHPTVCQPLPGSPKCRHRAQGHSGPGMCEVPLTKASESLLPPQRGEDGLEVQASDNELDPDQKASSFGDFHYHYIHLCPSILPSPSRFHLACQVSSSTSHKKLIPSRKSPLGFPLREQSS